MGLSARSARSDEAWPPPQAESARVLEGLAVDLGCCAIRLPDDIRSEADHRITAARRAAFDGFEQEAHRPAVGDLEVSGDGRLEIGDKAGPYDLGMPAA